MTRPVRIGVQLQPQHSTEYRPIRDAVRRCEDIGVDIAFNVYAGAGLELADQVAGGERERQSGDGHPDEVRPE